MSSTFIQAQHAAELAIAAMALRSLLAREVSESSEVVSIRVAVTVDGPGSASVDLEVVGTSGHALGGFSL